MKEIDSKKVETLAAQGLTMVQIAHCLGVAGSTLYKRKKDEAEISEAIKRGRSKGIEKVTNALFEAAKGGNITAQIFYLKNRDPDEWRDRKDIEHSGEVRQTHTHRAVSSIDERIRERLGTGEVGRSKAPKPH